MMVFCVTGFNKWSFISFALCLCHFLRPWLHHVVNLCVELELHREWTGYIQYNLSYLSSKPLKIEKREVFPAKSDGFFLPRPLCAHFIPTSSSFLSVEDNFVPTWNISNKMKSQNQERFFFSLKKKGCCHSCHLKDKNQVRPCIRYLNVNASLSGPLDMSPTAKKWEERGNKEMETLPTPHWNHFPS